MRVERSYGVTVAVDLVESLLEGPIPEAVAAPIPPRDRYPLRVFGNNAPPKGWFYTGPDPFGEFIKYQRGDQAQINNESDRQRYIDFFARNGYILVFKQPPGLTIRSQRKLYIEPEGIEAMEKTMGLTQQTLVNYNGQEAPASEIIYGQPNRANQAQAGRDIDAEQTTGQPGQPSRQLVKATFGGLYGDQGFWETGKDVNIAAMKKLMADGYAFVIKYPNGGFNVVTPKSYKFSPQEIRALESKMGITRKTPVQWFVNSVSANAMSPTTAQVAIYGEQPSRNVPQGLATPPPDLT
jgi:hypothetical protein